MNERGTSLICRQVKPSTDRARDDYEVLRRCLSRALHLNWQPLVLVSEGFAWPRLIALAHRHDVIPLLNAALVDSASVPASVRRNLTSYSSTVLAHNLALASELIELLELFSRSGVNALPFKGPAWAQALYSNIAHRQIRDLDIFVDRSEVARACQLLAGRGYVLTKRSKALPAAQCKDIELVHPETRLHLELHWSACEPWHDQRVSRLKLWDPVSSTMLLDRRIRLPSAEDIFFLLAIHGARHRWESLKWLCDIAALLQAFPELDWDAVLQKAKKIRRQRMALLPLALANQLFGIQLPVPVERAIERDATLFQLAAGIRQRHSMATRESVPSTTVAGLIYRENMRIRMRESMFERLGMLAGFLFRQIKPNQNDRVHWPRRKLPEPLYWLLRPFRLVRTYGPATIARFARGLMGPVNGPTARRSSN